MDQGRTEELTRLLDEADARHAEIDAADIRFDASFRELCRRNACGYYGRCWTCPPDVGEIDALIRRARAYQRALVFQKVYPLEDSYDIEGMHEAGVLHNRLTQAVRRAARTAYADCLVLGAGACGVCARCSKEDELPCRFPEKAVISLEACGVDVTMLARACGMRYVNGVNTVTYFGAVLFSP